MYDETPLSETSEHEDSQEELSEVKRAAALDIDVMQYEDARKAVSLEIVHQLLKQMQGRFA